MQLARAQEFYDIFKSFSEEQHPRHPSGSPDGGRFAPKGAVSARPAGKAGSSGSSQVVSELRKPKDLKEAMNLGRIVDSAIKPIIEEAKSQAEKEIRKVTDPYANEMGLHKYTKDEAESMHGWADGWDEDLDPNDITELERQTYGITYGSDLESAKQGKYDAYAGEYFRLDIDTEGKIEGEHHIWDDIDTNESQETDITGNVKNLDKIMEKVTVARDKGIKKVRAALVSVYEDFEQYRGTEDEDPQDMAEADRLKKRIDAFDKRHKLIHKSDRQIDTRDLQSSLRRLQIFQLLLKWDAHKHPRYPKGHKKGGQFMPKHEAAEQFRGLGGSVSKETEKQVRQLAREYKARKAGKTKKQTTKPETTDVDQEIKDLERNIKSIKTTLKHTPAYKDKNSLGYMRHKDSLIDAQQKLKEAKVKKKASTQEKTKKTKKQIKAEEKELKQAEFNVTSATNRVKHYKSKLREFKSNKESNYYKQHENLLNRAEQDLVKAKQKLKEAKVKKKASTQKELKETPKDDYQRNIEKVKERYRASERDYQRASKGKKPNPIDYWAEERKKFKDNAPGSENDVALIDRIVQFKDLSENPNMPGVENRLNETVAQINDWKKFPKFAKEHPVWKKIQARKDKLIKDGLMDKKTGQLLDEWEIRRRKKKIKKLEKIIEAIEKADFDSGKHPRYPKGHPKGGRFKSKGGIGSKIAEGLSSAWRKLTDMGPPPAGGAKTKKTKPQKKTEPETKEKWADWKNGIWRGKVTYGAKQHKSYGNMLESAKKKLEEESPAKKKKKVKKMERSKIKRLLKSIEKAQRSRTMALEGLRAKNKDDKIPVQGATVSSDKTSLDADIMKKRFKKALENINA